MTEQTQTQLLFYKNVAPLSRDVHKTTVFSPQKKLGFAANTHWVPAACTEFSILARSYPVVFVRHNKDKAETLDAIALLGLTPEHNDYLNADDTWRDDTYIPAFVRRYPFVPATVDETGEKLTVCIDESAPHFKKVDDRDDEHKTLFDGEGTPSPFLQEMVGFLQSFQNDMQRTGEFIRQVQGYDLLVERNIEMGRKAGPKFVLADVFVVDENKLNTLSGDKLADLAQNGALGWIYAHLLSLNNLALLFNQREKQVEKA
ncbi:MAG: SapC-like protein [Candidatus Tokpelaia hoelldobleri]|uniref:SapC-like protein n=1 Tax=Candidatus Tokpelaia hoelldobleri TaxID=1902579 RepID=A0A1U9JU17_9HYPH|nr:MAG: SapC-like protein [Candidatus Tokpelaia hoelldoblerii]